MWKLEGKSGTICFSVVLKMIRKCDPEEYNILFDFPGNTDDQFSGLEVYSMEFPCVCDEISISNALSFFESVNFNTNAFLILYKSMGIHYNKIDLYKGVWGKPPQSVSFLHGEEVIYTFNRGIVLASIAKVSELNIKEAVKKMIEYPYSSSLVFTDVDLTDYDMMKRFYDGIFVSKQNTDVDPQTIDMDYRYLLKCICYDKNGGFIRYAEDGEECEMVLFKSCDTGISLTQK